MHATYNVAASLFSHWLELRNKFIQVEEQIHTGGNVDNPLLKEFRTSIKEKKFHRNNKILGWVWSRRLFCFWAYVHLIFWQFSSINDVTRVEYKVQISYLHGKHVFHFSSVLFSTPPFLLIFFLQKN